MDKLIKHIILNLYPLIEAYSSKVMQQLMDKFKAEVEDFELEDITDEQIETYIKRFDQIKNSPKVKEKDLFNWTLPDLIRLITSSPLKGDEKPVGAPEDIVYTDQELEIYDASNEDRCVRLKSHDPRGRQESWCIGRGSFSSHRFNERRGFPSYYYLVDIEKFDNAAGDANHEDFADSFFVVSVNNRGKYVYTDRTNSPNYSSDSEWSEVESRFPILRGKNVKDKLKYIPLSDEEQINQKYSRSAAPIRDFRKFSFNLKKQYLIARKDTSRLFLDMDQDEFAGKVLPQYKELMDFVSVTPGIIDTRVLLKNLENYKNNNVKSIIANIREGDLGRDVLEPDVLPWEVRKLLVKYAKKAFVGRGVDMDKADLFVSKDEKYIFFLRTVDPDYSEQNSPLSSPIKLEAWSEFDRFKNVKLTPRTEQYLEGLDLSKYPSASLLSLVTKGQLKTEWVKDILEKTKKGEFKEISYKKVGEKEYFANFQDLTSFTIEQGRIKTLDFNSDEVQKIFSEEAIKGMISILQVSQDLPNTVNIGQFKSSIDNLSIEDRTIQDPEYEEKSYIAFTDEEGISLITSNPELVANPQLIAKRWDNSGGYDRYQNRTPANATYEKYFAYLRDTNQYFTDGNILNYILGNTRYWSGAKAKQRFAANNPPLSPDSAYVIVISEDSGEALLINKADPKRSRKVSNKSGKLIKLNLPVSKAIELAGDAITATPGRRGRRTGATTTVDRNAPLPELQGDTVQSTLEAFNLSWNSFPDKLKRKLHYNVISRSSYGNRGASRRRNMLGYRANIVNYYTAGDLEGTQRNAIYIIEIGAATFASIVMQPGNNHYVVTTDDVIKLSSPSQLRDKLRELDILTEIKKFIIKEYLYQNNKTMKTTELKKLVKEAVKEVLSENEPQQAPDTETPERETIPYTPPKPGEKKRRRRIGNPDADPNPKAMYEMEKEILSRIAKRFNKMKDD